jgi:type II secretory pathway pseudopilin PulG
MNRGFLLLEALLTIVVFAMVVLATVPMLSFLLRRTAQSRLEPQAGFLLQEGIESTYNILTSNWSAYPVDGVYHPGKTNSNKWVLFSGDQTNLESIYTRSITLQRVCRDANGNILEDPPGFCSGKVDPNSRVIKVHLSWDENDTSKELNSQYLVVNLALQ